MIIDQINILGGDDIYPECVKSQEVKKAAEDKKASAFFNAVVRAGKVNELDSTVLEYCEGDYDKAAAMLGISLDI